MKDQIDTTWEVWTYDVLGNARDGFEVNDRYRNWGEYEMPLNVQTHNAGTQHEFRSASPTVRQIRVALSLTGSRFGIETDGDDLAIYVRESRNGRPLGELLCQSHASLSPVEVNHV